MKKPAVKTIGIGVLIIAVLSAVIMVKTKPKAERKKMVSMVPVVTVTNVSAGTVPIRIDCLGTVIADATVSLQAEVSGQIVHEYSDLVEGAFIRKGDLLFEIDDRDYELAVKSAEASLRSTQSDLRIEEGQQAVAAHEMQLVGGEGSIDDTYSDLMLRKPQLESALVAVDKAKVALAAAVLDLERSRIYAPFDAVIETVNMYQGDYAQAGETLVELIAMDRLFVRASIPVSSLKYFPDLNQAEYRARIVLSDGGEKNGTLYKLRPGLTGQGMMASVLIAVDDPFASKHMRMLLLDEIVRVELFGVMVENVCLIDRRHLREGPAVWMMDADNVLRICAAQVVQGYADQVLVRFDYSTDWKMVTSNIAAPIDGMTLRAVQGEGGR